ncbi:MAG: restriction endonuclease, partial [Variovorax sp.]
PAAAPVAPPAPIGVRQQASWSPVVLADIEWRRFEAVCEAFYAQAGLATRSQSHGADGGVDIWLESQHMDQPRIVQCKHWQGKPVGVREVREFLGVMTANKLRHGTFVTSSTFTADALAFAADNGIHLQDGAALLKLIGQRTPEQQAALLAVAYEGEYWRPTCASCGTKMVERTSGKFARPFWGCANYPKCRGRAIPKARHVEA